jgi:hypothetical protein
MSVSHKRQSHSAAGCMRSTTEDLALHWRARYTAEKIVSLFISFAIALALRIIVHMRLNNSEARLSFVESLVVN